MDKPILNYRGFMQEDPSDRTRRSASLPLDLSTGGPRSCAAAKGGPRGGGRTRRGASLPRGPSTGGPRSCAAAIVRSRNRRGFATTSNNKNEAVVL